MKRRQFDPYSRSSEDDRPRRTYSPSEGDTDHPNRRGRHSLFSGKYLNTILRYDSDSDGYEVSDYEQNSEGEPTLNYNTTIREDSSDGYSTNDEDVPGPSIAFPQWRGRSRTPGEVASWVAILALLSPLFMNWTGTITKLPRMAIDSIVSTASSILFPRKFFGSVGGAGPDGRPSFVYEHPYVSSSYYTSTKNIQTLLATESIQVRKSLERDLSERQGEKTETKTRLAIVRPFCEFDAEALPTTFACWNALPPCKAARDDIGDEEVHRMTEYTVGPDGEFILATNATDPNAYDSLNGRHLFDLVGSDAMKSAKADVFLFYSQTFAENEVAIKAVDAIVDQFFEPGGWSQCFENIFAIEANIPQELDLYIPSAQEDLYNWVNGPNRQYEAAFRIIQSGEWGDYDGFYLMEGDSVPIKSHWLDVVMSEIEVHRPFAILGARYDGDKWDNFYEKIPISLLHHTNGNAIYNTSHPLLERLVGQLEVEAPCPYNSIPYDYRMSQMWVEGTLGIVPEIAVKIMLNEEGENITLSNNTKMFSKWAEIWERDDPFKYTSVIHNYAATNLIPRHLGPEYIIHGAKLYSPWDPTKTDITLVVSEWFFDRSLHLVQSIDNKDHPFSQLVIMVPPSAITHDDYDLVTDIPIRTQHRESPDFMDLCSADVETEWFMITNSYHHVSRHVDLMFTPGTFKPVIPFTPATYPFCFKYPYCKETISLAQRFNPGHDKIIQDMDMLYNTKERNSFCDEWREVNGFEGEDLYKNQQKRLMFRKKIIGPSGPTGTSYTAWLIREGKDDMYKLTDRSLYGARPPFIKIFAKEEKIDGMSEDELAKRMGMTLLDNSTDTDCNCIAYETEVDCHESGVGCIWRPLFESCHPPELIDGSDPICTTTEAPTMAPTLVLEDVFEPTESPIAASSAQTLSENNPWYVSMFKSREHDSTTTSETDDNVDGQTSSVDDDAINELDTTTRRSLETASLDPYYKTDLSADHRVNFNVNNNRDDLPDKQCEPWTPKIVPRPRTTSKNWAGASPDPESRSYSAMATSRPRLLHSEFLQVPPGAIDHSSFHDSWLTRSVPINIPKYATRHTGLEFIQLDLDTPFESTESLSFYKPFMNYGNNHSFEGAQSRAGNHYDPLRITFMTDDLLELPDRIEAQDVYLEESMYAATLSKIEAITGDILPSISDLYLAALSVVRTMESIVPVAGEPNQNKCGDAILPLHHLKEGVPDTDTLIYVTLDGSRCYRDNGPTSNHSKIMSYGSICSFDQHMRPLTGNLVICLNHMDASRGEVPEAEILRVGASLTMEVGKILGLEPSLYQYYVNQETGNQWGSTQKTVMCVDGTVREILVPNILDPGLDSENSNPYFQVASPTVKQVVRNHFDCQTLTGARLDRNTANCFGESLDPRYHFDEDMVSSGPTADMAYSLSPLTLALFEDSSWYKADFSRATSPLFGRGAGCGFVEGKCVSESKTIPDHGRGFYCTDFVEEAAFVDRPPSSCDYTHNHKAVCEVLVQKDSDGKNIIVRGDSNDGPLCPMRTENIILCSDESNSPLMMGEVYSIASRCFETNTPSSVCLQSYCNSVDSKIDIVVSAKVYQCDYESQQVDIGDYMVVCPRLAVICPHLVCPSNCSGKGVCDYCREVPTCVCDDPLDDSPGCWGGHRDRN